MEENSIKRHIVAEYLSGAISYRKLQAKYGFNISTIHSWVQQYQQGMSKPVIKKVLKTLPETIHRRSHAYGYQNPASRTPQIAAA
jgi:transposase-like protein